MTRKPPDRAANPTRESRRSAAVDVTLTEVVLDAQRRLNLRPQRPAPVGRRSPRSGIQAPSAAPLERGPLAADQEYADRLIELVYGVPGRAGEVPAASWVLPADTSSVGVLRRRIVAFATEEGVPAQLVNDLGLASSEALTNAAVHAFRDRASVGLLTASIKVDSAAGRITVLVADDGAGMTPRADSPGLGLGLPLVAKLARLLTIRPGTNGLGTQVCMTFAFPDADHLLSERECLS
jgi:serine/threonine-protein kinase RsbW/stage II sporulation protein AB (anti-sigma F factor)